MPDTIRLSSSDGVTTVSMLGRTMPPLFFRELGEAFGQLARDPDLRAVIVRADGPHFSYGLDLPAAANLFGEAFAGGTAAPRARLLATIRELQDQVTAVARCPVPVIAAVSGACIGGGLDLVSACDLRLATRDARFSLRETKVAIVADLGSLQRLPNLVGQGIVREMAFTGKDLDAARAHAVGLVNDLYDTKEALDAAAQALAAEIAKNPPLTVRGVKDVLDFGLGHGVADGLSYVATHNAAFLSSEDLGEALAAFMERRAPHFRGK